MVKKLLNVNDVSKLFQVHPETVRRWAREGVLPVLRPTARTLRFDLAEIHDRVGNSEASETPAKDDSDESTNPKIRRPAGGAPTRPP